MGGITYRLFARQQLAEIAFCAVSAVEQVKGYGTRLMDKLKVYVTQEEGCTHLITFADNNAVGYFQKQARVRCRARAASREALLRLAADVAHAAQGFSKEILLEREKWAGYIKARAQLQRTVALAHLTAPLCALQEYDGGTLMECILTARWPADFPAVIRAQREAVESKVKELTSSHIVYPGLPAFMPGGPNEKLRDGKIRTPVAFDEIDGLKAAGWCAAARLQRNRLALR